jgi:hypothetical protein
MFVHFLLTRFISCHYSPFPTVRLPYISLNPAMEAGSASASITNFPLPLRAIPRTAKFYDPLTDTARFSCAASEDAQAFSETERKYFMKYEVQTYTLCEGWVNCWRIWENGIERLHTFDSVAEAQDENNEFLKDIADEIAAGERKPDEGYDPADFRIVEIL